MIRNYSTVLTALIVLALLSPLAARPALAAKVPRSVLKEYFQTGDKPTQAQFADLIDSALNLVDDGLIAYSLRDSSGGAPRFDVGMEVGPGLDFRPLSEVAGFSDDWLGQSGFLPLAFEQDSQLHYAFLQISSPIPGAPNPYSMTVEYLVYEDLANTALDTQAVPEPATFALAIGGIAAAAFVCWRSRHRRANC